LTINLLALAGVDFGLTLVGGLHVCSSEPDMSV